MRKLKLLFAALALLVSAGVQAQSWTAPTIAGEDPVDGSQYKVMNVGAAKYLDMGQAWFYWSTTAILSDAGINFTMTADGTNWKFISSGKNGVFTSGNEIPGDAMHVDNTAHTYGITKLPNGFYRIHDVNQTATCWEYKFIAKTGSQALRDSWGVVAHADVSTDNLYSEWVFLTDLSAVDIYKARLNLYNKLNEAYSMGVNTDAAANVYNNTSATVDELNDASNKLDVAMKIPAVKEFINGKTGVDLTSFIENADFEKGNLTGWTSNDAGAVATNNNFSLKKGSYFVERWQSSNNGGLSNGSLTHDDVFLPAGVYCITADAQNVEQYNGNAGGEGLFLYANSNKTEISAAANYSVYTTLDEDGPLTIKFVLDGCTGNWVSYDNIAVTYYAQASDLLDPAIDAAEALNGKIPAAAYYALQGVVAANNLTSGTADEYLAAANSINAAVATYSEMVAPYATWKSIKAAAEAYATAGGHTQIADAIAKVAAYVETLTTATDLNNANTMATALMTKYKTWDEVKGYANALANVSNNNATANQTLKDAISDQASTISNASTEDQTAIVTLINVTLPGATAALRTAMTEYVNAAQPTNDKFFDLTGIIVNPHFTEGEGGKAIPTGWKLENGTITEHRLQTHNFEAYHMTFNLSQTIPGLPKGTYKVTLQGFARHDDGGPTDKTNLYCGIVDQPIKNIKDEYSTKKLTEGKPALGDGNGEAGYDLNGTTVYQPNGMSGSYYYFQEINPATNQPFYTNEVQTLITTAGDLKIGFKCETTHDWVIWDNFHLYYYGSAIAVDLDEAVGTSYTEDIDKANVTLKKTIYAGLNTIVLPFEADPSIFNGTALYEFDGYEGTTLKFKTVTTIEPNVPYLLDASAAATGPFTFNGVEVKAANELTSGTDAYQFVGTYQQIQVADGDYILGDDGINGVGFYRSSGGNKVKAYRAYIKKATPAGDAARLVISIDGVTTAIDAIDGQPINNAVIYNLAGQKVKNAQKGLYIQNGKKVVIK